MLARFADRLSASGVQAVEVLVERADQARSGLDASRCVHDRGGTSAQLTKGTPGAGAGGWGQGVSPE
ncbi:hypothetical protein SSBG_06649 [Streptomyces sp. SPB074]|nr:hypothetical protein SSBG_06649 [Streptomyces sp. SPB074]